MSVPPPDPKSATPPATERPAPADDAARASPEPATQGAAAKKQREIGGPQGPEPTRYGDWERNGRVSDF